MPTSQRFPGSSAFSEPSSKRFFIASESSEAISKRFPAASYFQNGLRNGFSVVRIFRVASESVFRSFGFPECPSDRFFVTSDFQSGIRNDAPAVLNFREDGGAVFRATRVVRRCDEQVSYVSCHLILNDIGHRLENKIDARAAFSLNREIQPPAFVRHGTLRFQLSRQRSSL
jgi:hypothetical protein